MKEDLKTKSRKFADAFLVLFLPLIVIALYEFTLNFIKLDYIILMIEAVWIYILFKEEAL